jgi:hypothetical protein
MTPVKRAEVSRPRRAIGPTGTAARAVVGLTLLAIVLEGELTTRGVNPASLAAGLAGIPVVVLAWQWLRARSMPDRLAATRPWDFVLNMAVVAALYLTPWYAKPLAFTADATLYFYGASMLLAAWRGFDGCEVLAVSNWLLHREDHVGCAVFAPVDYLERRWGRGSAGPRP